MFKDLYKNPIIIALFAGVAMIGIMYCIHLNKNKNKNKKKIYKIDFIPILIISLVVWFVANTYFGTETINHINQPSSFKIEFHEDGINMAENELKNKLFNLQQTKTSPIDKIEEIPNIGSVLFSHKTN